jgi:hypothetical protein
MSAHIKIIANGINANAEAKTAARLYDRDEGKRIGKVLL